jgi:hypothetical protein
VEEPIVEDIKEVEDLQKEMEKLEKTVSIRFANFSQLVKQQSGDSASLFNSHLMAILGGYLGISSGTEDNSEAAAMRRKAAAQIDLLDKSEEAMLSKNSAASSSGGLNSWQT